MKKIKLTGKLSLNKMKIAELSATTGGALGPVTVVPCNPSLPCETEPHHCQTNWCSIYHACDPYPQEKTNTGCVLLTD